MVKNVRVEYFFGYDLANIAKVEKYVREKVKSLSNFEMFYGMGDDVMNKLFLAEIAGPKIDRIMTRQWINIKNKN